MLADTALENQRKVDGSLSKQGRMGWGGEKVGVKASGRQAARFGVGPHPWSLTSEKGDGQMQR